MPCCRCKCCTTRKDRLVLAANKMVKEELKIVRWVQFVRVTEFAMRRLFTKEELEAIKDEAEFKVLAFSEIKENKVVVVQGAA